MAKTVRQSLEREIKLEANKGFVLPELPGEALEPEILVSTYYDTSDLRLAAAGLTLRRRLKNGGGALWQLKLPRGDARAELECAAPDAVPPEELTALVVAHTRGLRLAPAATLRTNRAGVRVRGIEGNVADGRTAAPGSTSGTTSTCSTMTSSSGHSPRSRSSCSPTPPLHSTS